MRNFILLTMAAIVMTLAFGCGDDNPVESTLPAVAAVWIFDSSLTNGVLSDDPPDTLTFRADMTGTYRSEIGWGPYDFSCFLRNDSIFRHRTAGQDAGLRDTCGFVLQGDQLTLTFTEPGTIRVKYLTRRP